jgi:alpha-tubulin suppressor-like RCC1 family protein
MMNHQSKIVCFGTNFFGQFGCGLKPRQPELFHPEVFGISDEESLDPSDVADIQCGSQFTVVLKKDGQVSLCYVSIV